MSDLIDRQKAINVIERMRAYIGHNMERAVGAAFIEILDDIGEDIGRLPSIQFATDTNVGTKLGTNLAQLGTDCISRQAAIDAIDKEQKEIGVSDASAIYECSRFKTIIKRLPSAQPKHGKWHYSNGKPATIGRSYGVICDQCGTESEYCTNFCPECGADMRGEHDE